MRVCVYLDFVSVWERVEDVVWDGKSWFLETLGNVRLSI